MLIENSEGRKLGITSHGRMMGQAVIRPRRLAETMDKERAFTCRAAQTPTGAASIFALVVNDSDEPLVIDRIKLNVAAAEVISVETLDGFTPAGGAAVTAIPRAVGTTNTFASKGTFYDAVAITGGGTAKEIHRVKTANAVDKVLDLSKAPIVLKKNHAMQLKAGTGTAALTYEISCYWAMIPRANG